MASPNILAGELPQWLSGKRICLPVQETQVRSLGQEDPLEKEMATHFCILAWEIPGTEEPGGLQSMGLQRTRYDLAIKSTMERKQVSSF